MRYSAFQSNAPGARCALPAKLTGTLKMTFRPWKSTRLWPASGLFYFALVFAAGFLFGAARELLVTPSLGPRAAELLEMPVMLAVIWFSARLVVSRQPMSTGEALGCGLLGLALLLCECRRVWHCSMKRDFKCRGVWHW